MNRVIHILGTMIALATISTGCYSTQPISDSNRVGQSYLELQVVPSTAEIYVDDHYLGVVERWREQVVPIAPGYRRLELRAAGFITQRFDLDVQDDSWLTLRVQLEPTLGAPGGLAPTSDPDHSDDDDLNAPPHPRLPTGHP